MKAGAQCGRNPADPAVAICGTAFLMALSIGFINLGLVFHASETLGFSATRVGWLPALCALTYVGACLLLVPRLQPGSPRRWVLMSLACLSLCFFLLVRARAYSVLLLLCALYGLSLSLFWPFLMGWMSLNREGTALGRSFSRYNFSWSMAMVFSPYLCGRLSEIDTRLPLLSGAALTLAAFGLVRWATPPVSSGNGPETKAPPVAPSGRATRLRYPAWLGLAVSFLGMGIFSAAFPVAARDELGFTMRAVGLLLLIRALFNMIAFLGLGFTERWHFRIGPMLIGQALGALAFGGLAFTSRPAAMAPLLALAGISVAFSYSISGFHGVSGAAERSTRMAVHEAMLSIGLVCGSAGGAMVYDAFGLRRVFFLMALLLAAALAGQAVWGLSVLRGENRR